MPITERFGQLEPRTTFVSANDARIYTSLTLISEHLYEQAIYVKYFNLDVKHTVQIEYDESIISILVELSEVAGITPPGIPEGSVFDVTFPQSPHSIKAKLIYISNCRTQLHLQFMQSPQQLKLSSGATFDVTLELTTSNDQAMRQFGSIHELYVDGSHWSSPLLLGRNIPKVPVARLVDRIYQMDGPQIGRVRRTWQAASLNKLQAKAVDNVFNGTVGFSFLRGIPGSGKSHVIDVMARMSVILGLFVLVVGPSNACVRAFNLKIARSLIKTPLPEPGVQIYYTIMTTKLAAEDMAKFYFRQRSTRQYDSDDDFLLRPFMLWHRLIAEFPQNFTGTCDADRKALAQWQEMRTAMENGKQLDSSDWRQFWKMTWNDREKVIEKTNLMACTCSASKNVATTDFEKRLATNGLLIVDEAAFCQEYSVAIPLRYLPTHAVFVGDEEQLQPVAQAPREYQKQAEYSLFARAIAIQPRTLVTTLNLSYRFNHRIADIPGMLTKSYGGILTRRDIGASEECFEQDESWLRWANFADSTLADYRRDALVRDRGAATSLVDCQNRDWRRIWVNVDGRSGKAPGSESTVNYANVWAIYWMISSIQKSSRASVHNIVVLVPLRSQLTAVERLLDYANLRHVEVATVDSYQGGEQDIVMLDFTQANLLDAAFIGFLNKWNRFNVAITRPKQALVVFGNIDLLRTRIEALTKNAKNVALFIMDCADRGDIVDLENIERSVTSLPRNKKNFDEGPEKWALPQPAAAPRSRRLPPESSMSVHRITTREKTTPTMEQAELPCLKMLDDARLAVLDMKARTIQTMEEYDCLTSQAIDEHYDSLNIDLSLGTAFEQHNFNDEEEMELDVTADLDSGNVKWDIENPLEES